MKLTAVALLALVACGARATPAPIHNVASPIAIAGTVRAVDWANHTYELGEYGTYTVKDRSFEFAYDEHGNAVPPDYQPTDPDAYVERGGVYVDEPAFGELTGDGVEEAAIVTHFDGGGTGRFTDVSVFTMRGGHEVVIGTIPGGDRGDGGIVGVRIAEGTVHVDRYFSEHGGACCPEQIAHERWTWRGAEFAEDEAARTFTDNPEGHW